MLVPRVPIKSEPINACSGSCRSAQEIMRKMRGPQPASAGWQPFEAQRNHPCTITSVPGSSCTCAFKNSAWCLGPHSDPKECQRGCPPPHPQPRGQRGALWDQAGLVLKLSRVIHHWTWHSLPALFPHHPSRVPEPKNPIKTQRHSSALSAGLRKAVRGPSPGN